MTVINLGENKITVCGHAGDGTTDGSRVCAAISLLVQLVADYLCRHNDKAGSEKIYIQNGYAEIEYRSDDEKLCEGVCAIVSGFRLLADSFPANVKIL